MFLENWLAVYLKRSNLLWIQSSSFTILVPVILILQGGLIKCRHLRILSHRLSIFWLQDGDAAVCGGDGGESCGGEGARQKGDQGDHRRGRDQLTWNKLNILYTDNYRRMGACVVKIKGWAHAWKEVISISVKLVHWFSSTCSFMFIYLYIHCHFDNNNIELGAWGRGQLC